MQNEWLCMCSMPHAQNRGEVQVSWQAPLQPPTLALLQNCNCSKTFQDPTLLGLATILQTNVNTDVNCWRNGKKSPLPKEELVHLGRRMFWHPL